MKKCANCKLDTRDTDVYCRNCGVEIKKNSVYIMLNVMNCILVIGIIFVVLLFIASYFV